MTCDACRSWRPPHADWPFGQCAHPKVNNSGDPKDEYSDYARGNNLEYDGLITGPKFGCIHHEQVKTVLATIVQGSSSGWEFEALLPTGKTHVFCRASFIMREEREQLVEKYPGLFDYRVTKEIVA